MEPCTTYQNTHHQLTMVIGSPWGKTCWLFRFKLMSNINLLIFFPGKVLLNKVYACTHGVHMIKCTHSAFRFSSSQYIKGMTKSIPIQQHMYIHICSCIHMHICTYTHNSMNMHSIILNYSYQNSQLITYQQSKKFNSMYLGKHVHLCEMFCKRKNIDYSANMPAFLSIL